MFYELESSAIERYKKSEGFIDVEDYPLPSGRLQRRPWFPLHEGREELSAAQWPLPEARLVHL